jgi:hypothetical protein
MKDILCSAGRGVTDQGECLACALSIAPCGYDYALLKAMYASSEAEQRRSEIHVTDLTGCLRRAWYDKCEPSPEYPHAVLVRWLGSAIHAYADGSDIFLESELPLQHSGIVGKADVVYRDGRVVDFKTTRWLYTGKLPYGSHALQLNIYAWMLRQMQREVNRLQIQYIDTSGPTKCRKCKTAVRMFAGEIKCPQCFQHVSGAHLGAVLVDVPIMTDAEVQQHIEGRRSDLEAAIAMNIPPEREPGYLCQGYCAHYDKCRPNLAEE